MFRKFTLLIIKKDNYTDDFKNSSKPQTFLFKDLIYIHLILGVLRKAVEFIARFETCPNWKVGIGI